MRVQDKYSEDTTLLKPLKNRPNLEPDASFIHSLTKIIQSSQKSRSIPIKLLLVSTLTIFLLGICLYNIGFTGLNGEHTSSPHKKSNSKNEFSYNINQILSENPNYHKMYKTVIDKAWGEKASGDALIYYFEALKNGDKKMVNKYAFDSDQTPDLIRLYHDIDFTSIKITKMVASKAEPAFQITFDFTLKTTQTISSRTLDLEVNDTGITIYDPGSSIQLY